MINSDKSQKILSNHSKQSSDLPSSFDFHDSLNSTMLHCVRPFFNFGGDRGWGREREIHIFGCGFTGLILDCRCFHNHIASLGGAADPPCAGNCADSGDSWTAGSCRAFGCEWWGWSFGWTLCRTPCTHVVSHLSEGTVVCELRHGFNSTDSFHLITCSFCS